MSTIQLEQQIGAVEGEVAARQSAFPCDRAGKRNQARAELGIARMKAVLETLKALRWIPCTERLPEEDKVVMIRMADGEIWTGFHNAFHGWMYVSADPAKGVKAWRGITA